MKVIIPQIFFTSLNFKIQYAEAKLRACTTKGRHSMFDPARAGFKKNRAIFQATCLALARPA